MYLTIRQQVKQFSKEDKRTVKKLTHVAKNLTNEAIYNIRQCYFNEKRYLSYKENNRKLKSSPNYKKLNSNMAQQIIMEVDGMFQSFFASKNAKIPKYLPKNGFTTLIIGFVRLKGNRFTIPYSNSFKKKHKTVTITIPPVLEGKNIKEIRILPKFDAKYFELQYTYKTVEKQNKLNGHEALAIDFGVNNLATCVTNSGKTFIIDGRKLKSINQWYNKENARLQSIKDKQKTVKKTTNRQKSITRTRNNKVNDYLNKAARIITNYCLYNISFQNRSKIGKVNNQNFVNIPFGKLREKLEYLSELYGIKYIEQEESYTSLSSFWDKDELPVYDVNNEDKHKFSGRRIRRGTYKTSNGYKLNADVNGALNIMRKSNVVSLRRLYSRGEVDTPARIRVP